MSEPPQTPNGNPTGATTAGDVTRLLAASDNGSEEARDQLLQLIYDELHMLARAQMRNERPDHTLSATALVNEAYFKMFGGSSAPGAGSRECWSGRAGFYAAAISAMRRVLTDHARANAAQKRGGPRPERRARISLDVLTAARELDPSDFLSLDEAVSRLAIIDERAATVVRLRFYAGLQQSEVAELLETSERTVKRDWQFAQAWLRDALDPD